MIRFLNELYKLNAHLILSIHIGRNITSTPFVNMGTMQDDDGLGYGSSLPVPSVQEIVRNDAQNIPERYIRNIEDRPESSDICPISDDIPIVDLTLLSEGDEDERKKLDAACQKWGFFQVILLHPRFFLKRMLKTG